MADQADTAQAHEERLRTAAISATLAAGKKAALTPSGFCHFCAAPVPPERKFCDPECRDDYQIHERARLRSGRS